MESPAPANEYLARLEDENRRLREMIERLEGMAYRDSLTELPNRRYFQERLHEETARSRRDQSPFSVLAVDLDGFKQINDTYGHSEGDRALQWIARFLVGHVRESDVCCRIGGDEFMVLLPGLSESGAAAIRARLKVCARDEGAPCGLSIGCSTSYGTESAEQTLERADRALYREKASRPKLPTIGPRVVGRGGAEGEGEERALEIEGPDDEVWIQQRRTG